MVPLPLNIWDRLSGLSRHTLLLVIVTLGGVLRFYQIGSEGLWLDEAFSVWLARQSISEMLSWLVRIDQHPPLYYTLLHFWMRLLGDGPATVRFLSALFGVLTIPVVYLLDRRLAPGHERVGLLAALLLAVSPFHVRLAQEARMYTLLALTASLALYALARLLDPETHTTGLTWLGYIIFAAATMLTHNTAVFFLIATNLFALSLHLIRLCNTQLRITHYALRNWLTAQAAVFLLWLPWLPAFLAQSARVYREFWLPAPTWETVIGTVGVFLVDYLPLPLVGACAVGVLIAGLALSGLLYFRRQPAQIAFLLIIFATPFLGEGLVSLRRPIFYDRTLIWASIPLYLLLTAGISQLETRFFCKRSGKTWFLVALITLLTLTGLSLREYYIHFEKEQWDDAAAFVAERVEPDDLILFNTTWAQIPFDYYFHRLYNYSVAEHGAPVDLFDRGVLEPKMTGSDLPRVRALVRGRGQVWLIYSHSWYTDPQGLIPPLLEEELGLLGRWDFYGLRVALYGRW
jgi:mannosyltransferase